MNRDGFTLIELLIVAVVGSLFLMTVYTTLQTNQRVYTVQGAQIRSQQTVRTGVEVLFAELREVSAVEGDLLGMGSDTITIRAMRSFGIVCALDQPASLVTVRKIGNWFSDGDSIVAFADGIETIASDDTWLVGTASTVDTTVGCPAGAPGQALSVPDLSTQMAVDSVRLGAPVRSFEHYKFGLYTRAGRWYVGRRSPGGTWVPLVGPVQSPSDGGLEFIYRDSLGVQTATIADVNQIDVIVRTESSVTTPDGRVVGDSLAARVFMRN